MKKEIKQLSNTSVGITFTKSERDIYGIEVGDVVDLTDMYVLGPRNFPSANHKTMGHNNGS